jgi:circadian clock protein KaiC
MAHSNQIREFLITDEGIDVRDVYVGPEGVLTGSMRLAQEAREKADKLSRELEVETKQRSLARKRAALEAQISAMRAEFEGESAELDKVVRQETNRAQQLQIEEVAMAWSRQADKAVNRRNGESVIRRLP